MAECPVVPFFGAFLRELREILASSIPETGNPCGKPPKSSRAEQAQQRQVVGEKLGFLGKTVQTVFFLQRKEAP